MDGRWTTDGSFLSAFGEYLALRLASGEHLPLEVNMQRFSLPIGPISMAMAIGSGVLLVPEMAAAESRDGFTCGIIVSFSTGVHPALGIGLDLRYSHYDGLRAVEHPPPEYFVTYDHVVTGAFLQATYLFTGNFRFAFGGHGGYLPTNQLVNLDGEIGLTFRTSLPTIPGGVGLHLGFVPAFTLFLAEQGPSFRGSIGFSKQMGNEFIVGGDIRGPSPCIFTTCPYFARPLRMHENASPELAPLVLGPRRRLSKRHDSDIPAHSLAAFWLRETSAECASIPAFLALARDLARVGAPSSLVENAQRAAIEEAKHTRLCAELAGEYTGMDVGARMPRVPRRMVANQQALLERLAIESCWDGCIGEGAAAARARRLAVHTHDVRTRETLSIIARDEQGHADLAADILRFCIAVGGKSVRNAIAESIELRRATEEDKHSSAMVTGGDELQSFGLPNTGTERVAFEEAFEASLRLVV